MRFFERLSDFKDSFMFIRWVGGNEYAKLVNVGEDYLEFQVIDVDTMDYQETILIHRNLLLEVSLGGSDVARILAEMSCNLPTFNKD